MTEKKRINALMIFLTVNKNTIMKLTLLTILSLSFLCCNAQNAEKCDYRTEKGIKKINVTGICIPDEYIVFATRSIDIDGDGIDEYIVYWRKEKREEGDTTFISIYKQVNDTTVMLIKMLDNYYPLYIDYDKKIHSEKISKLLECYAYSDPQGYSSFSEEGIYLNVKIDAGSRINLEYKYDKDENDWYLLKKTYIVSINEGLDEEYVEMELSEEKEWFRDFSYQKILGCDE